MNGLDDVILQSLYAARNPVLVQLFIRVTELGSVVIIGGLALALALWLLFRGRYSYIAGLLVTVGGTAGVVFTLKEVIARARPDVLYQAYLETGHSFPSGHAALSLALYGYLAFLAHRVLPRQAATIITVLAGLLVVAIGFSRLYLGFHYFTDTLGGYAIAAAFLWIGIYIAERFKAKTTTMS